MSDLPLRNGSTEGDLFLMLSTSRLTHLFWRNPFETYELWLLANNPLYPFEEEKRETTCQILKNSGFIDSDGAMSKPDQNIVTSAIKVKRNRLWLRHPVKKPKTYGLQDFRYSVLLRRSSNEKEFSNV